MQFACWVHSHLRRVFCLSVVQRLVNHWWIPGKAVVHSGTFLGNARSGQMLGLLYPSEECDIWSHNAQFDVAINSWLPCRTLLWSQVEWGQYGLSPHYHSLGLYWVSQILLQKPCCESARMSCSERWPMLAQWTMCSHLTEDGDEGDRVIVWFRRFVTFPKKSGRSVPFQEKDIWPRSSEACMMSVTAGATSSAISFINQEGTPSGHVVLWDLRLQSSLLT